MHIVLIHTLHECLSIILKDYATNYHYEMALSSISAHMLSQGNPSISQLCDPSMPRPIAFVSVQLLSTLSGQATELAWILHQNCIWDCENQNFDINSLCIHVFDPLTTADPMATDAIFPKECSTIQRKFREDYDSATHTFGAALSKPHTTGILFWLHLHRIPSEGMIHYSSCDIYIPLGSQGLLQYGIPFRMNITQEMTTKQTPILYLKDLFLVSSPTAGILGILLWTNNATCVVFACYR